MPRMRFMGLRELYRSRRFLSTSMRNASPPGAKFVLCVSRRRGPESDMPDDTDTDSEAAPPDRGSPFPGCFILIAILTVFGGLVVLYTVVGSTSTAPSAPSPRKRPRPSSSRLRLPRRWPPRWAN